MKRRRETSANSARQRKLRAARVSKFILTAGDEGAILLHIDKGQVVGRYFTPELSAPETDALMQVMSDNPKLAVVLLLDTMEQTYVQQTMPPVSQFSLGKLMKRRLDREFSDDYLKSAMVLGREEQGRRDWIFMMIALQYTPLLRGWLEKMLELPNRCAGIRLLPVEAAVIVRQIVQQYEGNIPKEESDNTWYFLVSYNKVSGLRQAIFRNGKMVLTRLGQPAVGDNPEAVAGTVEQEIIGTTAYLRRLMHNEHEKVRLILVVAEDIKRYIDVNRLDMADALIFNPHEAAKLLNIPSATQPTDSYGDVVLAAAIGMRAKPIVALVTPELRKQQMLYTAIFGQRVAIAVVILGLMFSLGSSAWDGISLQSEAHELKQKKQEKQQALDTLKAKTVQASGDLERIADVVDMYTALHKANYAPEPLLIRLSGLLREHVQVTKMEWAMKSSAKPGPGGAGAPPAPPTPGGQFGQGAPMELKLDLEFAKELSIDRKVLQQTAIELLNKLKAALPGFEINYDKLPGSVDEQEQLNLTLSQDTAQQKAEAPEATAQLIIIGPADQWKEVQGEAAPAIH